MLPSPAPPDAAVPDRQCIPARRGCRGEPGLGLQTFWRRLTMPTRNCCRSGNSRLAVAPFFDRHSLREGRVEVGERRLRGQWWIHPNPGMPALAGGSLPPPHPERSMLQGLAGQSSFIDMATKTSWSSSSAKGCAQKRWTSLWIAVRKRSDYRRFAATCFGLHKFDARRSGTVPSQEPPLETPSPSCRNSSNVMAST
jgi:hypothetical protein